MTKRIAINSEDEVRLPGDLVRASEIDSGTEVSVRERRGRVIIEQALSTMDPDFRHPALSQLARVENPVGVWKVEGQK